MGCGSWILRSASCPTLRLQFIRCYCNRERFIALEILGMYLYNFWERYIIAFDLKQIVDELSIGARCMFFASLTSSSMF